MRRSFQSILSRRMLVYTFMKPTSTGIDRSWRCRDCGWTYSRVVKLFDWDETLHAFDDLYAHVITHVGHVIA